MMYLKYDSHIHSEFSTDSAAPMEVMARAAVERGLLGITFTDHYHPDYPDFLHRTGQPTSAYHSAIERTARQFSGRLEVLRGLEMGVLTGPTLPACEAAAEAYPYDFLLAAFHSTRSETFDGLGRARTMAPEQLCLHYYSHVLTCIRAFQNYDSLAHLNLVDRYAKTPAGGGAAREVLDEIYRTVIAQGKGLEVNTSSHRYGMGTRTTPTLEMLRRYRELGGEIVTVGSDAHAPEWVGSHLDEAGVLLRAAGFKHYAVFRKRSPEFFPL